MKITNIIEIPKFISTYISNNIDNIDYQLHSFCKYLLNRKIDSFMIDASAIESGIYQFEYNINDTCYDIKYFINFYLEKTKLDSKLDCLYEQDTGLSKSITNETFIVELESDDGSKLDTIDLYIDSFMSDKLVLKSL